VGTAAQTTAGMKEAEFGQIADFIDRVLRGRDNETVVASVREEVAALCGQFNPYANFTK